MLSTAAIVKSPLRIFGEQAPPVNWSHSSVSQKSIAKDSCNGVGSYSVLGGHCSYITGHNFYGENYIPME